MKFIMYHYVRPRCEELPYFRYLELSEFCRQLDHFQAEYGFVSREEFDAVVAGQREPGPGVVLTFDDGVSDHYDHVMPELERRGLWGIFYIPTGMYHTRKLLDVHRVHCLLGRYGGAPMIDAIRELITDEMVEHSHVDAFRRLTYARQVNDEATVEFKRILNYYISVNWRERILDQLMARFLDESRLIREYYVAPEQLGDMQRRGMMLGAHSVTHSVFSNLQPEAQQREIDEYFAFLTDATGGLTDRTFAYPYGGFHSFTPVTEQILSDAKCTFSLNVEPRDAATADFRARPQALPRYDCNAFPFGKCAAPLVGAANVG